ncbi:MAG: pirin family protein [Chryseobacterium sp.]|nr:pirin family protein [Chryseobacterium sp.]
MKTVFHKAETRGGHNHGWLKAYHSFSFANFIDPSKMNFGALRVLNDDTIQKGMGFGHHGHSNMEIITIPLSGELAHKDSMGNSGTIQKGEIQVMSAGTGIQHSEFNGSNENPVSLFQIWVIPNKMDVEPRYDQFKIADHAKVNDFQQIISPDNNDEGSWIHQESWFNLLTTNEITQKKYSLHKPKNGVYIFVISGSAKIGDKILDQRDALGISDAENFEIEASENSEILLMEVPMSV